MHRRAHRRPAPVQPRSGPTHSWSRPTPVGAPGLRSGAGTCSAGPMSPGAARASSDAGAPGRGWSWSATGPPSGAGRVATRAAPTCRCSTRADAGAGARAAPGRAHRSRLVLTSPLLRARETCAIAGFGPEAQVCAGPAGVGLRRLRGQDDRGHPGRAPGMVVVARRGARGRDAPRRWQRGPTGSSRRSRRRTGDVLAFAHAPRAACRRGPVGGAAGHGGGACSPWRRPRSASWAGSATRRWSPGGTTPPVTRST